MNKTVLILNGPGLADLDDDSSHGSGDLTLAGIRAECADLCAGLGLKLDFRQTDNEEEMSRWITRDSASYDAVIINPCLRPADPTIQSYRAAIRMITTLKKPIIEVHLTNIYRQVEEVTQPLHEPVGDMGFICGFGKRSYSLAIRAIARKLEQPIG